MTAPTSLADEASVGHLRRMLTGCLDANKALENLGESREKLSTPRIVVVGDQSFGKSTVISRVTNIRLPSSTGICTRAPLRIASRTIIDRRGGSGDSAKSDSKTKASPLDVDTEMAQLSFAESHISAANVTNLMAHGWQRASGRYVKNLLPANGQWPPAPAVVQAAVQEATTAVAGPTTGVVDAELLLDWRSKSTPNLDVIDLPGLVLRAGPDQDHDVPEKIESMVKRYIEDKKTIIMCVFNAHIDAANFRAIELVKGKKAIAGAPPPPPGPDPKLERTLVVITKLDQISSLDLKKTIEGHLVDLKSDNPLAVSLVASPGGEALDFNAQLEAEQNFFRDLRPFQTQNPGLLMGMPELVHKLTSLLADTISADLPALKSQLKQHLYRAEEELSEMVKEMSADEARHKFAAMQTVLNNSLKNVLHNLNSEALRYNEKHLKKEATIWSQLHAIFDKYFTEFITVPNYMDDANWARLAKAHAQTNGYGNMDYIDMEAQKSIFFSEFLNAKVDRNLHDLIKDAFNCVEKVYHGIIADVFHGYTEIQEEVRRVIDTQVLGPQKEKLKNFMAQTFQAQYDLYNWSDTYQSAVWQYAMNVHGMSEDGRMKMPGNGIRKPAATSDVPLIFNGKNAIDKAKESVSASKDMLNTCKLRESQFSLQVHNTLIHSALRDQVPKAIRYFLVREVIEKATNHIFMYDNPHLHDKKWLHERFVNKEALDKRKKRQAELEALTEALAKLESIPAFPRMDPLDGL
ncbi:hypothetical protein GPECTOR_20g419 [Gonium pectorale]|uniref:Dynamin-type G domain-containing protein n=1 Tax=Gonium pectorale TaxID=33097 RepID=A0A150GIB3_GONPE|nr:hypothetical protein GPECTOR_20g419 [Gonium pectorale]|eukprot:KXZ49564.1 hypothetical protein GPECTOR_20g419 [Gonium pectorale]